jgi:hypothetical protein
MALSLRGFATEGLPLPRRCAAGGVEDDAPPALLTADSDRSFALMMGWSQFPYPNFRDGGTTLSVAASVSDVLMLSMVSTEESQIRSDPYNQVQGFITRTVDQS